MRNENYSLTARIIHNTETLPYFTIDNLMIIGVPSYQMRIALSRLEKREFIIRLKRGFYASRKFIENCQKHSIYTTFIEFIATKIYAPSYLSLDYILYENNILTEVPVSFTLVTRNKTLTISNKLGRFIYHKIKNELFDNYRIESKDGFIYHKADKVKALFDFLYLRKNMILNKVMAEELRLNLQNFKRSDITRLQAYVKQEGSQKMIEIFRFLF